MNKELIKKYKTEDELVSLERYRVRPEHKFKVGDWVKYGEGESSVIFKIFEINYSIDICYSEKNEKYFLPTLTPWKPKTGEWCLFSSGLTSTAILAKFSHVSNNDDYMINGAIHFYESCEPFIGELPEFLKG